MSICKLIQKGQEIAEKDCGQPIDAVQLETDGLRISANIDYRMKSIRVHLNDVNYIEPFLDYVKHPKRLHISMIGVAKMYLKMHRIMGFTFYSSNSSGLLNTMKPHWSKAIDTSNVKKTYNWINDMGLAGIIELENDRYVRIEPSGVTIEERSVTPKRISEMPVDIRSKVFSVSGYKFSVKEDYPTYRESILTEMAHMDATYGKKISIPVLRSLPVNFIP